MENGLDKNEKVTILVVEDNDLNMRMMLSILKKIGEFNIVQAINGLEGVKKYGEVKVNIILTDIQMPKMNGVEMTEAIRKVDVKIPIIAVTAYAAENEREKFMKIGMNDYISKPCGIAVISRKLNDYLSEEEKVLTKFKTFF